MTNLKSLVLLCLLPLQALAAPTNESPIPGYGIEELTWQLEVFPGKGLQNFTGTIEKVIAQVKALNPEWKVPESDDESNTSAIDKRYSKWTQTLCYPQGWRAANKVPTWSGISYLRGLRSSAPTNGPGPGNCGRVSCSYQSAIYWCNDNRYTYTLGGWGDIADGAHKLYNDCGTEGGVCGQVFTQDNWNVIVRYDNC